MSGTLETFVMVIDLEKDNKVYRTPAVFDFDSRTVLMKEKTYVYPEGHNHFAVGQGMAAVVKQDCMTLCNPGEPPVTLLLMMT
jgi:hypothetical protein